MSKTKLLIFVSILSMPLAACGASGGNQTPGQKPKYTVTWKNWNDIVLETDTDVEQGTMPSYDGKTPTKDDDAQYKYTFEKWTPNITSVSADITYKAVLNHHFIKQKSLLI